MPTAGCPRDLKSLGPEDRLKIRIRGLQLLGEQVPPPPWPERLCAAAGLGMDGDGREWSLCCSGCEAQVSEGEFTDEVFLLSFLTKWYH